LVSNQITLLIEANLNSN